MIFIPLMLLGIALYFTKWRVWSGVIFLFFISYGFQFVPEKLFDTGFLMTQSPDFALIYILGVFVIACMRYDDFVVRSRMTIGIFVFLAFIVASIFYSRYYLGVAGGDTLKISRYYFFVLGYFVFRRLSREDVLQLLRIAFFITTICCSLYVLQTFTGIPLLAGAYKGEFGVLNRYFNIPVLYYILVTFAFFCNPYKGFWKYYSIVIFCLVAIFSQHRGLMVAIFATSVWGVYLAEGGFKGVFKYLLIGGLLLLPVLNILLDRFASGTSTDFSSVVEGEFVGNMDAVTFDGTFAFRMAILYERVEYVLEKPERITMGVGFMTEGSEKADQEFDFKIGLHDEKTGRVIQLLTSDIAWVVFVLRLGFVGTIVYLSLYFILGRFFYIHRNDKLALAFLLYIVIISIGSLSSAELSDIWMIVVPLMIYGMIEIEEKNTGNSKQERVE